MIKNVATVATLINALNVKTKANSVITDLTDKPYWAVYNKNHVAIDNLLKTKYYNFVLPNIPSPLELSDDGDDIIMQKLTELSKTLHISLESSLDKLWELESVKFSPIENYDRYELYKTTHSGQEKEDVNTSGKITNTTKPEGSDVVVNVRTGSVKDANGGKMSVTEENEVTSYNPNRLSTVVDTTTDERTKTTTYNSVEDRQTMQYDSTHVTTQEFDGYNVNTVKTYDDVVELSDNHIHGNIGVTTATAMMTEYVTFYDSYSFWIEFWDMYITLFASPIFETSVEYYSDMGVNFT